VDNLYTQFWIFFLNGALYLKIKNGKHVSTGRLENIWPDKASYQRNTPVAMNTFVLKRTVPNKYHTANKIFAFYE
jgi:hypothetical protein